MGAQKHIAPTKTEVVNALGYTPPEKDTITPVDITLSETSTNPVRNSTVTKAINDEKNIREQAIDTLVKEVRDENKIEVTKIFSLTFTGDYFYNNRDGTQGGSWKCTDFSSLYDSIRITNKPLLRNPDFTEMYVSCSPVKDDIRIEVVIKIDLDENMIIGSSDRSTGNVTDEGYPYIVSANNKEIEIALGLFSPSLTEDDIIFEGRDGVMYSTGSLRNLKTTAKGSLLGAVNELVDVNETKLEHRFVSELPNTEISYDFEETGAASIFIGAGKGSVGIGTEDSGNKYNYIRMNSSGTGSSDVYRATFDFGSHINDDVYKITVSFDAYWNTSTACRDAILIGDKAKLESNVSSFNDSVGAAFYFAFTGTNTITAQNNGATARNTEGFYDGWVKYAVVIDLRNKKLTYDATPINGGASFKGENVSFKDTSTDIVNCLHIRTRISGEEIRVDNVNIIMHSTATENKLYLMETETDRYDGYVYKNGIATKVITGCAATSLKAGLMSAEDKTGLDNTLRGFYDYYECTLTAADVSIPYNGTSPRIKYNDTSDLFKKNGEPMKKTSGIDAIGFPGSLSKSTLITLNLSTGSYSISGSTEEGFVNYIKDGVWKRTLHSRDKGFNNDRSIIDYSVGLNKQVSELDAEVSKIKTTVDSVPNKYLPKFLIADEQNADALQTTGVYDLLKPKNTPLAVPCSLFVSTPGVQSGNYIVTNITQVAVFNNSSDIYVRNKAGILDDWSEWKRSAAENAYSAVPQKIGTWIDGTPVWRVAFEKVYNDSSQYNSIDNIVNLFNLGSYLVSTSSTGFIINRSKIIFTPSFIDARDDEEFARAYSVKTVIASGINIEMRGSGIGSVRSYLGSNTTYCGYVEFVTPESNIKTGGM